MPLKPFAFILINTLNIFIHFMISCFIIKIHCQRLLQMLLYSVQAAHPHRAHGALEDPTALPQRCVLKINAVAWRSMRLHSIFTAFPRRGWRLHSAHLGDLQFFKRCGNAVRRRVWCDRGLNFLFCNVCVSYRSHTNCRQNHYRSHTCSR